jgi:hypothetical protein
MREGRRESLQKRQNEVSQARLAREGEMRKRQMGGYRLNIGRRGGRGKGAWGEGTAVAAGRHGFCW